jgi:hypothetical protein
MYLALPWLVLATLLEGATRLFFDAPAAAKPMFDQLTMCLPDDKRVWRYKPSYSQRYATDEFDITIATNTWGLRDRDIRVDEDAVRVLVVGDSFTFGWGVEAGDRYSERLATLLGETEPRAQVLNAGHWMATFDQQLLIVRELLPKFRPHIVVQGVYPGHVLSIDEHEWTLGADGTIERIAYRDWWNEIRISDDGTMRRSNRLIERPPLGSRFVAKLTQRFFRWRQVERESASVVDLYSGEGRLDGAWEKTSEALRQTSRLLAAEGVAHLVFSVPADISLAESERAEYFRKGASGRTLDFSEPYRRFAGAAREAAWLDLHPVFVRRYKPGLYFPRDPHWTPAGHRLAAEALLPCVRFLIGRVLAGKTPVGARCETLAAPSAQEMPDVAR